MLFNSPEFIFLFLPATVAGFFLMGRFVGRAAAMAWLALCSLFFYGYWRPPYVLLLGASILFNYYTARALDDKVQRGDRPGARRLLAIRVALNLALLGYFKYARFFASIANDVAGTHWHLDQRILPLGISF